jgi:adenine phosphoribosyltransferase
MNLLKYHSNILMQLSKEEQIAKIKGATKSYNDFKKDVVFIDIFPIITNPEIYTLVIQIFAERLKDVQYDKMFMLESKGFLFGPALALQVGKGCYPVRKKGKLPGKCSRLDYKLEYGEDTIEVQTELIKEGDRVVIIDDVLATGGTMNAAIQLLEELGAKVECVLLLSRVAKLEGDKKLKVAKEKVFWIYDD